MLTYRRAANSMIIAAALALAGCAMSTPYQPDRPGIGVSGGYSEQRLDANRFRVTFRGNSLTSRRRVESYMLYRAAELTLQQGHDWFRIIDRVTEAERQTYVEPEVHDPWYHPGHDYWRPWWRYYRPGVGWTTWYPHAGDPLWEDRAHIHTIERFEAHADISMHDGPMPADSLSAFDARQIISQLEPRIEQIEDQL